MPTMGMPMGRGRHGRALENPNSPPPTVDGRWAPPRYPWTGDVAVQSLPSLIALIRYQSSLLGYIFPLRYPIGLLLASLLFRWFLGLSSGISKIIQSLPRNAFVIPRLLVVLGVATSVLRRPTSYSQELLDYSKEQSSSQGTYQVYPQLSIVSQSISR